MHADDILNNQFQLRLSSRITALDIPPVAFKTELYITDYISLRNQYEQSVFNY